MTGAGHRQVEHTADLAIELWADSEENLLREGARALAEILTEGAAGDERETRAVEIESIDSGDRLVQWLNEVVYLATVDGFLVVDADIELHPKGLRARARGFSHAGLPAEIKSATYHDLQIHHTDGRWRARVVLDV
jgi:SHS2 domain-containing protein